MDLCYDVTNQKVTKASKWFVVNKSQNYLNLCFDFKSEDWEDCAKYIIFHYENKHYRSLLDEDGSVRVPNVVLQGRSFRFTLYGSYEDNEDNVVIVTGQEVSVALIESGFVTEFDHDYIDDIGADELTRLADILTVNGVDSSGSDGLKGLVDKTEELFTNELPRLVEVLEFNNIEASVDEGLTTLVNKIGDLYFNHMSVKVVWVEPDGDTSLRPANVNVTLKQGSTTVGTYVLNEANEWSATAYYLNPSLTYTWQPQEFLGYNMTSSVDEDTTTITYTKKVRPTP